MSVDSSRTKKDTSSASSPKPQLFPDFSKHLPTSPYIFGPYDDTEPNSEEITKARENFIDQIFKYASPSLDIIQKTNFIILMRALNCFPTDSKGKPDIYGYNWYVGHYDWSSLIDHVIELNQSHKSIGNFGIYLIPTLGQSMQGSKRHELTYNAFLAPADLPPFNKILQRPPPPENSADVDDELYVKSDPCKFVSLQELNMSWVEVYRFNSHDYPQIKGRQDIIVQLLSPNRNIQRTLNNMSQADFELWFDTIMGNFLPVIPKFTIPGESIPLPLVLIDPVESTPPIYKELINVIDEINEHFPHDPDVHPIKSVIRYWQYVPVNIEKALESFAVERKIPDKSPLFNEMFFEQYNVTKDYIIDDILSDFLGIKRESKVPYFHGAAADIDEELEMFDEVAKKKAEGDEKRMELLSKLKEQISIWFMKPRLQEIYTQFKEVVSKAMNDMLDGPAMKQYLQLMKEENDNIRRHEWLQLYEEGEISFCLWPTIYRAYDEVLHEGDQNPLLIRLEEEELLHAHCTLIDIKATVLPPK